MNAINGRIALEIPQELLHATRMNLEELRQELAFSLFAHDRLSFGKARELAGMSLWQFQAELNKRALASHYDVEDFEEDVATLTRLGRL